MFKITKLKNGCKVYMIDSKETALIGGKGVCDCCNSLPVFGFLVPIVNRFMCPDCFVSWFLNSEYDKSERSFENYYCTLYESKIPVLSVFTWKQLMKIYDVFESKSLAKNSCLDSDFKKER